MNNPLIKVHNIETDAIEERPMTDAEALLYKEVIEADVLQKQAEAEAQAKRQALLNKLGITEDEAQLLLGGN